MNSGDLSKAGFSNWLPFNRHAKRDLLPCVPKAYGVYAIRYDTPILRMRGSSDIVYIGSAANRAGLRARLSQYFSPGPSQSTNKRILALVAESSSYQVSWLQADTVSKAIGLEQELLDRYCQDHGELPPQNLKR